MHPKIKSGELHVALFSNVIVDNSIMEAIGIFKSKSKRHFLKFKIEKDAYSIDHEIGIQSLDKGCFILNTNSAEGYKILILENASKSVDAQYWKGEF